MDGPLEMEKNAEPKNCYCFFIFGREIWFRYSRYTVWGQVIEVVVYFKCFFFSESS